MAESGGRTDMPPLSTSRIVDTALDLIAADGGELTMRNLARALGATPMSLYRHVRDKADLETLIADRILEDVDTTLPPGDWREQAAALHGELRRVLLARPAVGRLVTAGWVSARGRTRLQDRLYGVLREAGFRGPDVVIAADALELFTLGSICHDLSDIARAADPAVPGRLAHVTADGTPNLVEYAVFLARRDAGVLFASGYAALLEGLDAALVRNPAET